MTKLSVVLTVAVSLTACEKNNARPAADDCTAGVDRLVDAQVRIGMASGVTRSGGSVTPEVQATMDRMEGEFGWMSKAIKQALTKACTEDRWSAEVLACLRGAAEDRAIVACNSKLTAAQRDHAEKVTGEAMTSAAPKGDTACNRYADFEIKCADAGEDARPVILDFCAKARAGKGDTTFQLIRLETTCAETSSNCEAYEACVEKKKRDTPPE